MLAVELSKNAPLYVELRARQRIEQCSSSRASRGLEGKLEVALGRIRRKGIESSTAEGVSQHPSAENAATYRKAIRAILRFEMSAEGSRIKASRILASVS